MSYTVPNADHTQTLDLPPSMRGTVVESTDSAPRRDPAALVREALAQSLGMPPAHRTGAWFRH